MHEHHQPLGLAGGRIEQIEHLALAVAIAQVQPRPPEGVFQRPEVMRDVIPAVGIFIGPVDIGAVAVGIVEIHIRPR